MMFSKESVCKPNKKALAVANYFLYKNSLDQKELTNKKLQKLLYYSQAWSLALNNKKIFPDKIEAWVHGPAVPSVYFVFKDFGFETISKPADRRLISCLTPEEKKLLDDIWLVYGKYPADYLEALSHSEKPWQTARERMENYEISDREIAPEIMKSYYVEKIKEQRKKARKSQKI